jgi:hypothetical protein
MATSKGKAKTYKEIYLDLPALLLEVGSSNQGLLNI